MCSFSHLVAVIMLKFDSHGLKKILTGKVIEHSFERQTYFLHKMYRNLIFPSYFLVEKMCIVLCHFVIWLSQEKKTTFNCNIFSDHSLWV